jgi:hypothetical protein
LLVLQGGSVKRTFGDASLPGPVLAWNGLPDGLRFPGFDFGKMVFDATKKAEGATGAAAGAREL